MTTLAISTIRSPRHYCRCGRGVLQQEGQDDQAGASPECLKCYAGQTLMGEVTQIPVSKGINRVTCPAYRLIAPQQDVVNGTTLDSG